MTTPPPQRRPGRPAQGDAPALSDDACLDVALAAFAEPDVPPIDAARAAWYELEVRKNERAEWLVSSRGTISRAEDARDMLRVPQSFDLQQAEWVKADYERVGYETRLIRYVQGEGGIVREVVE